ncbi:MAG: hypothetical protein M3416_11155 [Acidobacteriota bacterium]|nr:hypothetical protein [Acidobacteriota bacterium]
MAKQWRGVTPLRSTREDVERLLGRPLKPGSPLYETEKESVYIIYSIVPCEEGVEGAWNVPPDTVIRIEVTPKKALHVRDLDLEESKYVKVEQPHVGGAITYVDEEQGVVIKTRYEEVLAVHYGPTAKDKHLACSHP